MTVKLLADYEYRRASNSGSWTIPAGRVVGLFDSATETGLINAKLAVATAAAADWTPPSDAPSYDLLNPAEVMAARQVLAGAALRPAAYYGVVAGTADMTARLLTAINASVEEQTLVQLPPGVLNISGEVLATAPQTRAYQTASGTFTAALPVGLVGFGGNVTTIVQNQAGARHFHYAPSDGVLTRPYFKGFRLKAAVPSFTNARQAGIQLGGVAGRDIVVDGAVFDGVVGEGLYAVVRVDDCTGLYVTGSGPGGSYKYYVEGGYNADQYRFFDFNMSTDAPQDVACTNTSGTNTLAGISGAVMPYLFAGMSVTGAGIPADTTIIGKGANSVSLSANTTAAVTQFCSHLGTLLSLLGTNGTAYTGSGFATVANEDGYYNKLRASNPNTVAMSGVCLVRGEGLVEDAGGAYNLTIRDSYMERPRKVLTSTGPALKGLAISNLFLSQPQTLRAPWITSTINVPQGRITDITTDGTLNTAVAVSLPNVTSNSEFGPFIVENIPGQVRTGAGADVQAQARKVVLGSSESGNAIWNYDTASGDANFDGLGIDIIEVTLSGSGRTLIGPNSTQIPQYRRLRVIFSVNSAGATFTLGAKYRKADGSAWGLITAGAAGQRAWLDFTYMGNGTYISSQSALGWS